MHPPKLKWLGTMCSSLGLAMGTHINFSIQDSVDPLKKIVFLDLVEDIGKKDFNPLQVLIHGFAKANDCVVYKIYKGRKQLILEVLTKTRLGPVMNNNPLITGDKVKT